MSRKQWLLAFVLFDFIVLNLYVMSQYGVADMIALVTANAVTVLVMVDLTIALSLVSVWMWNDARDRGMSALPYVAVTLLLGSIGPLIYLLRTTGEHAPVAAPASRLVAR
jgi:4-amino-4-deoxy-L-arabinose transferase-like glycosyltransferase